MRELLGNMSGLEAVELVASAGLDPDDADRADVRWALQMEALHAFTGAERVHAPIWWLQRLPWRPEYVSAEEKARREATYARAMGEFKRNREQKVGDG